MFPPNVIFICSVGYICLITYSKLYQLWDSAPLKHSCHFQLRANPLSLVLFEGSVAEAMRSFDVTYIFTSPTVDINRNNGQDCSTSDSAACGKLQSWFSCFGFIQERVHTEWPEVCWVLFFFFFFNTLLYILQVLMLRMISTQISSHDCNPTTGNSNPSSSRDFELDCNFFLTAIRLASLNQILDPWVYLLFREILLRKFCIMANAVSNCSIEEQKETQTALDALNKQNQDNESLHKPQTS